MKELIKDEFKEVKSLISSLGHRVETENSTFRLKEMNTLEEFDEHEDDMRDEEYMELFVSISFLLMLHFSHRTYIN